MNITVKQLASVVGIPVERLLVQLTGAGIEVGNVDSTLNEQERVQLLSYLRRSHGKDEAVSNQSYSKNRHQIDLKNPGKQDKHKASFAEGCETTCRRIGVVEHWGKVDRYNKRFGYVKPNLFFHENKLQCDPKLISKDQYITYDIRHHQGKDQLENINLLEKEKDVTVLMQAFSFEHASAALVVASSLFSQVQPEIQIRLAISILPGLTDLEKTRLIYLFSDDALRLFDAASLRAHAPISRKIEIWNSVPDPKPLLNEMEKAMVTLDEEDRARLLPRLSEKILLLPEAKILRSLLPLTQRFGVISRIENVEQFINEIELAMQEEGSCGENESPSREFWQTKCPSSDEPLFAVAPAYYKKRYWQQRYKDIITALEKSIEVNSLPQSSWLPLTVYGEAITEEDRQLAGLWAKSQNEREMAKMLAARCAEKVAMRFYKGLGYEVRDVAIEQLGRASDVWQTHDLELNDGKPIDVKNSRCQIHRDYYVAHEVKHKHSAGREVTLTTILSPYLKLEHLDNPDKIPIDWHVPGVRVLGETVKTEIEYFSDVFVTDNFNFEVDVDQLIPSWLSEFPTAYYASQTRHIEHLREPNLLPPDEAWEFLSLPPVSAFVRTGSALPTSMKTNLHGWQIEFIDRLQKLANNKQISRPYLYLAILSHFLDSLRAPPNGFDPAGYRQLLFSDISLFPSHNSSNSRISDPIPAKAFYPCGLYDPLARVYGLCDTLNVLWQYGNRKELQEFRSFRLSSKDLLLGRKPARDAWVTLVAYCGGDKYHIINNEKKWIGKCLNYPLIFGREKTCQACNKLICDECHFCTKDCPDWQRRTREISHNSEYDQIPDGDYMPRCDVPFYGPDVQQYSGEEIGLDDCTDVDLPRDDIPPCHEAPPWWDDKWG
jgi:hypothetical protein